MTWTIRPIEEKDNASVEKVIRTCLIEYGGDHEGTAWADPDLGIFSKIYDRPGNRYWVLVDEDDQVLGGTGIGELEALDGVCELQKMYLLKEARGKGYGKKLLDHALNYAKDYYRACYIETLENMEEAQALYEKAGFERLEEALLETDHYACEFRYLKKW